MRTGQLFMKKMKLKAHTWLSLHLIVVSLITEVNKNKQKIIYLTPDKIAQVTRTAGGNLTFVSPVSYRSASAKLYD